MPHQARITEGRPCQGSYAERLACRLALTSRHYGQAAGWGMHAFSLEARLSPCMYNLAFSLSWVPKDSQCCWLIIAETRSLLQSQGRAAGGCPHLTKLSV